MEDTASLEKHVAYGVITEPSLFRLAAQLAPSLSEAPSESLWAGRRSWKVLSLGVGYRI